MNCTARIATVVSLTIGLPSLGHSDSVSVTNYGAVADSNGTHGNGTDNYDAFYDAIYDAIATQRDLFIPEGTYRVAQGLQIWVISNNITIYGEGKDESVLFVDNDTSEHALLLQGWEGGSKKYVQMQSHDFAIKRYNTGVLREGKALILLNTTNCVVRDMDISGSSGFSLVLNNAMDSEVCYNEVHDSVWQWGGDGIHIEGSSSNVIVHHNHVYNTGDDCIAAGTSGASADRCRNIVMESNIVHNTKCNGFKVTENATDTYVRHNVVYGDNLGGITIQVHDGGVGDYANNIFIYGNIISNACGTHEQGSYWGGITVLDWSGNDSYIQGFEIHDNTILSSDKYGIIIVGTPPDYVRDGAIFDNYISDYSYGAGPVVMMNTSNVVEYNNGIIGPDNTSPTMPTGLKVE